MKRRSSDGGYPPFTENSLGVAAKQWCYKYLIFHFKKESE